MGPLAMKWTDFGSGPAVVRADIEVS